MAADEEESKWKGHVHGRQAREEKRTRKRTRVKTRKRYLSASPNSEWDRPDVTVGQFLFQTKQATRPFFTFKQNFALSLVYLTVFHVWPQFYFLFLANIGFEVPKFCGVTETLASKLSQNVHVHIQKLRQSNITSNNYGKQFCVNLEPPIEG